MKTKKRNSTFSSANQKLHVLRILSIILVAYLFVIYPGSAGATGTPISIYAPSFDAAKIASFQLNGHATTVSNKLQLTSNGGDQFGTAFWKSRIYQGTDKSFSAYFTFQINGSGGIAPGGADGLAFVIQTSTATAGSIGSGMGYEGITPSIAVEFDTWGENGGNHVAIVENGCPSCTHTNWATPSFTLDGGTVGHVWVDYNGATDLFEVRLSTTLTRPASALVSATLDLATKFAGNNIYVGFTAATGEAYSNHYIQDLFFQNSFNPSGIDPVGSYEQALPYAITYHVTSGGSAVEGVSVAVNGETLTTDASGNATINLAAGIYPFTVSKNLFTAVSGTTTVSAANVTENITLAASLASGYCAASKSSSDNFLGITHVAFNTIHNTTANNNPGYTDFTGISTPVVKGRTYTLSVYGWGYPQNFKVWFDWNKNGDFVDDGEEFSIGDGTALSASTSITIPSDATTGNVLMRVRSENSLANPSTPTACGAVQYGECEDYTINILEDGPTITISPESLHLGYTVPDGTSDEMSYTLSGSLLSPASGNITITPPANFEVSKTSGSGFSTSAITVAYASGTLNSTTIYVRFKPTSTITYYGSITHSGGSATTQNVDLTGSADYCIPPVSTTPCWNYMTNVTTTGGLTNFTNFSDCAATSYTDYSRVASVSQIAGGTVNMSFTSVGSALSYAVWIDFNDDGTFGGQEKVVSLLKDNNSLTASTSFTVPSDAQAGAHLMRIMGDSNGNTIPNDPCTALAFGETEDYRFIVAGAGTCTTPSIGSQSTATETQCLNGTFTPITVTATGDGLTYQWYFNASNSNSGGTTLGTSNGANTFSYTPQSGTAGTLYYYCVVTGTCGTPQTSAVSGAFIVNAPSFSPPVKTLADLAVTGTNIKWYTAASGGSELPSSTSITSSSTTYYASQTINSVESTARLAVTARVDPTPCKPTGNASQSYSTGSTVANLQATGTSIKWYSDASGGTALATSTTLVNGTHYWATQTLSCTESATRLEVVVTIN